MQTNGQVTGSLARATISLRPTAAADLAALFEIQSDEVSNAMAGTKPRTREVFFALWAEHLANAAINSRVIVTNGAGGEEIAGGISCFQAEGMDCVGYWIARSHWGKGIATQALQAFLKEERRRPLHATAVCTNVASRRILEKCGFRFTGTRTGEETERFIACEVAEYVLEGETA